MVTQILIHLDGNGAVLVGLGGGGQVLTVLVVFLIEVQGQIGQLLIAVKLERVGPLLGDIGEMLRGAVRPRQGDRVSVTAHSTGAGIVRRPHGKDGLRSAHGIGKSYPGPILQAGRPARGAALVEEVVLPAVRQPGAGREHGVLIGRIRGRFRRCIL